VGRILVVDDEPDILLLLRMNLEAEGHDVLLAADGEMALARIAEHKPDLVLLDVMMPLLDGWGVLEAIDGQGRAVVVVSAKADPRDAQKALELGALDYLTKPFDLDRLLAVVDEQLDRSPAQREAAREAALREMQRPSGAAD
jgi:DNA-binding response OmpR family regulator